MAEQHGLWEFYTGDVWRIYVTFWNDDGKTRMNVTTLLSQNKIEWWLLNGNTRLVAPDKVQYINIDAAQGDVLILVDDTDTLDVPPGRYEDRLRLIETQGPRTKWEGQIYVKRGVPPT